MSIDRQKHPRPRIAGRIHAAAFRHRRSSLFDGHDAAINIMRRLIQAQGAEVVHLGPQPQRRRRRARYRAAGRCGRHRVVVVSRRPCRILQVHGGHAQGTRRGTYPRVRRRRRHDHAGGNRRPAKLRWSRERIYHPNDGMHMGLTAMIEDVVRRASERSRRGGTSGRCDARRRNLRRQNAHRHRRRRVRRSRTRAPAQGMATRGRQRRRCSDLTGTGGAGKSSVVDELLLRFLHAFPHMRIAVLAVDPTRRRSGRGALLGDRITHEFAGGSKTRVHALLRWQRAASTRRPTSCSRTASLF